MNFLLIKLKLNQLKNKKKLTNCGQLFLLIKLNDIIKECVFTDYDFGTDLNRASAWETIIEFSTRSIA